jgi:hypothetical protein
MSGCFRDLSDLESAVNLWAGLGNGYQVIYGHIPILLTDPIGQTPMLLMKQDSVALLMAILRKISLQHLQPAEIESLSWFECSSNAELPDLQTPHQVSSRTIVVEKAILP